MFKIIYSFVIKGILLPLFMLLLLCGCNTSTITQSPQALASNTQTTFTSYVGHWEVHGAQLTINADHTGFEQWNAGPCAESMCNEQSKITFTENADGSIKGTFGPISIKQWNGGPAPSGFQLDTAEPLAGDTFQFQHNGTHLLYTTWFGKRLNYLNTEGNRYWCDAYALKTGWKQCGA